MATTTKLNGLALSAASLLALSACATNPVTGQTDLAPTMSVTQEQSVGDNIHPVVLKEYGGAYANPRISAYVNDVGQRIAAHSDYAGKRFTFTVLNSPVSNAFAVPGGYIYVTRGLLSLANSEAELAGVLGHEIGHVTARHSARRQTGALLGDLVTIGAAVLGGREAAQAAQLLAGGTTANYSRSQELESDTLGVRYISRAGYDPYEQADFLSHLQNQKTLHAQISGRNNYDPDRVDFFASHPATPQRVVQAINQAKASGVPINAGERREEAYLQNIKGMLYGEAGRLRPQRLDVVRVRRGQSVAEFARRMPFEDFREERFRVLNGLQPGDHLQAGQYVKVVTE